MSDGPSNPGRQLPVRALLVSRLIDQGVLGVAALVLARHFGPSAFAPVGMTFVFTSLALQLGDHGLSFALLRSAPDTVLRRDRLRRVRATNIGGGVALTLLTALVDPSSVAWVAAAAGIWVGAAEAYVRRSAWLKARSPGRVARCEGSAAIFFALGCVVVVAGDLPAASVGGLFVVRHLLEAGLLGMAPGRFADDGEAVSTGAEWLGQAMTYAAANVDYVAVAALLAESALSVYVLAFRLASAVPALLAMPAMQQAFVDVADSDQQRAMYHRLLARAMGAGLAGSFLIAGVAVLATAFLGEGWSDVTPTALVLAVAVPWRMALGIVVATALVLGKRRQVVLMEAARAVLVGCFVLAGSVAGLMGVTVGVTVATMVSITLAGVVVERALPRCSGSGQRHSRVGSRALAQPS